MSLLAPPPSTQHQIELQPTPLVSTVCFAFVCPIAFLASWFTLNEGEHKIVLNSGFPVGEVTEPGCHFYNCCNREIRSVSTKKSCMEIRHCKVADKDGNPIIVSAVIVGEVVEPRKALLEVQSWNQFVTQQALTILRQITSMYSFESHDGAPSLRSDTAHINEKLAAALEQVSRPIGVRILSFRLDEISYSQEIASLMLKRQAAKAIVDARKVIVEGAVGLSQGALQALKDKGVALTQQQATRLVNNLLTVLCSSEGDS